MFEWSEEERGSRKKHICWNRKKVEAKKFEDVEMSTLSDAQERWVDKKWRLEARKNLLEDIRLLEPDFCSSIEWKVCSNLSI